MGSGLLGVLAGRFFLNGLWWSPEKGVFTIGTPLLFDVGVFLVVLGAILTLVLELEEV